MDVGLTLRTVRCARRISQRELAALAGVPRSTVDRIEADSISARVSTLERLLAATGYQLAVSDRHGRLLVPRGAADEFVDRGGRRFPAHLESGPTPGYFDPGARFWWGWHNIAWPFTDDWVPENTYWRGYEPYQLTGRNVGPLENGYVWDDAT